VSTGTRAVIAGAVLLAALAFPSLAAAHASGVNYRSPIPVWLYGLAGGLAVLASAPAAAFGLTGGKERASGNLYPAIRRLRLGRIGLSLSSLLLAIALVGGFFGAQHFFDNPATILIWVDFWVGLGIVSALVANVWDFVSPLSALGRWLERLLAARGSLVLPYPARLGVWPAVLQLLAWTWAELVWEPAKEPRTLAVLMLAYIGLQLVAMAAFGTEVWLARGELFTVFARTLVRFAPLELYVRSPAGRCRADRCVEEERIGCPACWLDAAPEGRGLRLRAYGAGVRREPPLGAGGGTFVLATLGTVIYDGFSQTNRFSLLEADVLGRSSWLSYHISALETAFMTLIVGGFALLYLLVCALLSRFERVAVAEAARRYAPTLIPISAVYFISHYFLYLVYIGQFTPAVVLDPLEREWIPDYGIWADIPGGVIWYLQVGLIVWGHIVAVFAAHRLSLRVQGRPRLALVAQSPLVLLMVGYTFVGLWVLGQALTSQ